MAVSLTKGQKLSLSKQTKNLDKVILGLGWDITPGAGRVDLDASAATFDASGNSLETIYYGNKKGHGGAISHSGDNLTGDGDGDDEQIVVDLNSLPQSVQTIMFTVTSFTGQKLDVVTNAYVRVVNSSDGAELCRYTLSEEVDKTALLIAYIYRHNGEWKIAALGEPTTGKTVRELGPAMKRVLFG